MEDRYRLVFRGEVLEGQHPAVVKKRLGALLKVDGPRLDSLFTGDAVVIRKEADKATAAKVQAAFRQSGARLRVFPVSDARAEPPVVPAAAPAPASDSTGVSTSGAPTPGAPTPGAPAAGASTPGAFTLRPPSGELLDPAERKPVAAVEVDVGHLTLAPLGALTVPAADAPAVAPDTSHLSVAEVGADLGPRRPAPKPAVDVARVHFDVAEPGVDLGQKLAEPPPPPPDTAHLQLR